MLKNRILEFLKVKNPALNTENFEDLPLFSALDSMGFLELLSALETELEIELDLSEFDPEEFSTLGKFCAIIESLKESK
ncbi:phosphopantetheine-binding protein [Helicobacter sp.]|uniref:phosphopantetheine-binding protein n=1 Tax=Helicobacter sp. TaxID=218 RepID=UPI0025C2E587|nr:phosphopantetheine-binding protein [Helicobacter sp.]MCI5968918.1 phosphopantetheine-binding protein [Helicobacter sp.]MDY2585130.1 phosphopantetheine-binding protein [Helicobacter sp.]